MEKEKRRILFQFIALVSLMIALMIRVVFLSNVKQTDLTYFIIVGILLVVSVTSFWLSKKK